LNLAHVRWGDWSLYPISIQAGLISYFNASQSLLDLFNANAAFTSQVYNDFMSGTRTIHYEQGVRTLTARSQSGKTLEEWLSERDIVLAQVYDRRDDSVNSSCCLEESKTQLAEIPPIKKPQTRQSSVSSDSFSKRDRTLK
jgi:hypothetical protein